MPAPLGRFLARFASSSSRNIIWSIFGDFPCCERNGEIRHISFYDPLWSSLYSIEYLYNLYNLTRLGREGEGLASRYKGDFGVREAARWAWSLDPGFRNCSVQNMVTWNLSDSIWCLEGSLISGLISFDTRHKIQNTQNENWKQYHS